MDAYDFFKSEMLHEFPEFRLCDGSWKLDHWATLNYPSWVKNNIKAKVPSSSGRVAKKGKAREETPSPDVALANPDLTSLLRMEEDTEDQANLDCDLQDSQVHQSFGGAATVERHHPFVSTSMTGMATPAAVSQPTR
jgi:hypothetical protein